MQLLRPGRASLALACVLLAPPLVAQIRPTEGIRDATPRLFALTNARIISAPGTEIGKGTIVVRDGMIAAVGGNVKVPADARVFDCRGLTIYPGFIEPWFVVGSSSHTQPRGTQEEEESSDCGCKSGASIQGPPRPVAPPAGGPHWNPHVRPERSAADGFTPGHGVEELREDGFTIAHLIPKDGLLGGRTAVVSLADESRDRRVIRDGVAAHATLGRQSGGYPRSLMGRIALIRQTLFDARWHAAAQDDYVNAVRAERPERNAAFAALAPVLAKRQPLAFDAADDLGLLRALRIARELDVKVWLKGNGMEYRRMESLRGVPLIVPVAFPKAPKIASAAAAEDVTLAGLRAWDRAPANAARLAEKGIEFSLTTAGITKHGGFHGSVRKAIERGLSVQAALSALTVTPAKLLGISARAGTIAPERIANLVVTDGPLFGEKTRILETWIDGRRHVITRVAKADPRGNWSATLAFPGGTDKRQVAITIAGKLTGLRASLGKSTSAKGAKGDRKFRAKAVTLQGRRLHVVFDGKAIGEPGMVQISGRLEQGRIFGTGALADGSRFLWSATGTAAKRERPAVVAGTAPTDAIERPEGAFGRLAPPEQPKTIVVKGATVWTCAKQGKVVADLWIERGKIKQIAANIEVPAGAVVIAGQGKHVTPGLIDAHSHTAISGGINEGTHATTSECRIGDVLNSADINLYRQLAGGLTAANVLHGSANPIGGQMQVIKLRWGAEPAALKFAEAAPGIKFALGENVKQSRSPDGKRYPRTRMGVEQVFRDRFAEAREYDEARSMTGSLPVRPDLRLDALVEIMAGKRMVHCHSYRQDEILMLMRVAENFGFRVSCF
ncbi:MAG: hypothetical protein CMJ85_06125, partial [Planctomycetes bacterium]|nr:hypothetical protein [Planctomycetota bacterium]